MNPENEASRTDPERQRAMRHRERRRRQICWSRVKWTVVIVLALAMVTVTVGRALQPSKDESSPAAIKGMAAEDFTSEPVEHEDRHAEPVVSVEPEPEGQEGTGEGDDPMLDEQIEATLEAEGYFRDDVPLSYELQDQLHTACEESGVPYALALAIIEKETRFQAGYLVAGALRQR